MRILVAGQRQFAADVIGRLDADGHAVVTVVSPPWSSKEGVRDRARVAAETVGADWMPAGALRQETMPDGIDLIVAAHSHDFIGAATRNRATHGAIGYHPSLLPLHRGRDAIRWALRDGDRVTGGSVYWLDDRIDAGPLAAQAHVLVPARANAADLWRTTLAPLGVRLLSRVVGLVADGRCPRVAQDESIATFEPSMDVGRIYRPDLPQLPPAGGFTDGIIFDARPEALDD